MEMTEMEKCVICGKVTDVPKDMPVSRRTGYVEGAGQLCSECYRNMNDNSQRDRELNDRILVTCLKMGQE